MTNENIIKQLKRLIPSLQYADDVNAVKGAIQALSQEPCEDAISRDAVLDEIDDTNRRGGFGCRLSYTRCRGHIKQLPSVQRTSNADKKHVENTLEDAISRQAALNSLIDNTHLDGYDLAEALDAIENKEKLPSVTQKPETVTEFADRCRECGARYGKLVEQKSGKWIVDGSVDCYLANVRCHCSECGKKRKFPADYDHIKQELSISYKYPQFIDNYCPNCGAKMESEVRNDKSL